MNLIKYTCYRCSVTDSPHFDYENYEITTSEFCWGWFFLALFLIPFIFGLFLLFFCYKITAHKKQREICKCKHCGIKWERPRFLTYEEVETYNETQQNIQNERILKEIEEKEKIRKKEFVRNQRKINWTLKNLVIWLKNN